MKLLILLLLFCISLEIRELPKYGSISFFGTQFIYLNLDGFKSGDNVSFHLNCTNPKYSIQYRESNSFSDNDFKNYSFSSLSSFNRVAYNNNNPYDNTNDFTINLTGNYKYLLLKVVANNDWFTIVNKKKEYDSKNETNKNETYSSDKESKSQSNNKTDIDENVIAFTNNFFLLVEIIIGSFVIIVIVIIVMIIYCACKCRSEPDYARRIDSPLMASYPGVQPQPQPQQTIYTQPGYQPYGVQSGYP